METQIFGFNFPQCATGYVGECLSLVRSFLTCFSEVAIPNQFNDTFVAWNNDNGKVVLCLQCFDQGSNGGLVTQVTSTSDESLCYLTQRTWRDLSVATCYKDLGTSGAVLLPASLQYVGRDGTAPPSPLDPRTTTPSQVGTAPPPPSTTAAPATTAITRSTGAVTPDPTAPFRYSLGPCTFDFSRCAAYRTSNCSLTNLEGPIVFDGSSQCANNVCMRCRTRNGIEVETVVAARLEMKQISNTLFF